MRDEQRPDHSLIGALGMCQLESSGLAAGVDGFDDFGVVDALQAIAGVTSAGVALRVTSARKRTSDETAHPGRGHGVVRRETFQP